MKQLKNRLSSRIVFLISILQVQFSDTVFSYDTIDNRTKSVRENIKIGRHSVDNESINVHNDDDDDEDDDDDDDDDEIVLKAVYNSIADWENRRQNIGTRRNKRFPQQICNRNHLNEKNERNCVCYADFGCFRLINYVDLLPYPPDEVNTRFMIYNSRTKTRDNTPLLEVSAQNISSLWRWADKVFISSASTKIIVHGFGSSCSHLWIYEMRSALMSVENCNVICVDWEAGAAFPNYVRAAANTRLVGRQTAKLLTNLEKYVNISVRNVHVIGFSLGAHIAGFAGSELKNLSRITGLDPAGPLFENQDFRIRLDPTDAQFVDVIHSNGDNLILGGLGAWQAMGHVDFYPNGGRMQKGCTNIFVGAVSDMIWPKPIHDRSLCNHRRAYKLFTDSISPKCVFPAVPCESYDHFLEGKCFLCDNTKNCNNMGYYSDKFSGRGTLYLSTREEKPFCAEQYLVKVENSPTKEGGRSLTRCTFGKIQVTLIGDLDMNETFVVTQKTDDKLVCGKSFSRVVVPHPALRNIRQIQILYVAYKGWIASGHLKWKIDKISLTTSYGQIMSICKKNMVLESGIPLTFHLLNENCSVDDYSFQSETSSNYHLLDDRHHKPRSNVVNTSNLLPSHVEFFNNEIPEANSKSSENFSIANVMKIRPYITETIYNLFFSRSKAE